MALLLTVVLFILIVGMWIVRGRERWAWPGLASATFMWFFGTFGAHLWNASRNFKGAGVPPKLIADASLDSPAASALLWASAGSLLGVIAMAIYAMRRRKRVVPTDGPRLGRQSKRLLADILQPTSLVAISGAFFLAWALGQGPSLWSRNTYLAADGIGALLTATTTPAPLIGATALAATLIVPTTRRIRAIAIALGAAWWICTLAVGTRLTVLFPMAALVAIIVVMRKVRPSGRRLFAYLALVYVTVYVVLYSFGITLEVRHSPHGISRLPQLLGHDGLPNPLFISWGPIIMKMVSSVASSYVITHHSVLHPAPAEVLWMNANPLPQSIAGVDAFSHERMWPYSWVPLSMVGEWFGVYGPIGQLALYGTTAFLGAVSVDHFVTRKQRYFAALTLVLAIATTTISIQYPSRWFWRLLSLTVALPLGYSAGVWLLNRMRPLIANLRARRRSWRPRHASPRRHAETGPPVTPHNDRPPVSSAESGELPTSPPRDQPQA